MWLFIGKLLSAIVGAGVLWFGKKYVSIWLEREYARSYVSMDDDSEAFKSLMRLLGEARIDLHSDRILILKARNGGGPPRKGSKLRASIVWESFGQSLGSFERRWQDVPVDEHYVSVLEQAYLHGRVRLYTNKLPEGTMLANVYKSEGILKSKVAYLKFEHHVLYYVSVNFTEDVDFDTPEFEERFRFFIQEFRRQMEEIACRRVSWIAKWLPQDKRPFF